MLTCAINSAANPKCLKIVSSKAEKKTSKAFLVKLNKIVNTKTPFTKKKKTGFN